MSAADRAVVIGVDWGTSSLRVSALDADGQVLAEHSSDRGILTVQDQDFDAVLETMLAAWQPDPAIPLVLSGMITSRNGWCESPYLSAPCRLADLAGALLVRQSQRGRRLHFVPGVKLTETDAADVMRGEETELFGWLARRHTDNVGAIGERLCLLPGTHSKWVQLTDAGISHFSTCMTGELFALLCRHSILGRLMNADDTRSAQAFERGARYGLAKPGELLATLFSARALPLLDRLPARDIRDYLAGLLIGSEVAGQVRQMAQPVVIIGRGDLVDRYATVLRIAGVNSDRSEPGAAAAGQFALARQAALL